MSAAALTHIRVPLGARSYTVAVGANAMQQPLAWQGLPAAERALIVSNEVVAPRYEAALRAALAPHYARLHSVVLPDGEAHKGWPALERIFEALLDMQADRRTPLVALGGGVVGDLAGLAAALYMRGVPVVQVPTTLLAQVDASVGGKTAINLPRGKNLVGAFHQPALVVCDLALLRSLPAREWRAGMAEVIKTAAIADADFLAWLEAHGDALAAQESGALAHLVARCVQIKANVVGADERESARRAILNFGHTFGHAIEAVLGFGVWLHGEAVAAGMVMAADLSVRLGLLAPADAARLTALIARAGLPVRSPPVAATNLLAAMRADKKAVGGRMQFVLLPELGDAVVASADDATVLAVLHACGAH